MGSRNRCRKAEGNYESRLGKDYFDTTAATAVNGNTKKAELTESPFLVTFEYGGDRGYWTGNHMILQVEDCIDCLRVLNNDRYRYAFLFDHSSGHAKKCIGGLDVGAMNKGFGGEHMTGTLIKKKKDTLAGSKRVAPEKA